MFCVEQNIYCASTRLRRVSDLPGFAGQVAIWRRSVEGEILGFGRLEDAGARTDQGTEILASWPEIPAMRSGSEGPPTLEPVVNQQGMR
jgi:hypothetical protein